MITIKLVGDSHPPGLARSASDQAWFNSPAGMAGRMGSGPSGRTCLSCAHLDLAASRWSDRGRACQCLEARRLRRGKRVPEVPVNTAACNHYVDQSNAAVAFADADRHLDERAQEKLAEVKRHETILRRLREEISEIDQERKGGA